MLRAILEKELAEKELAEKDNQFPFVGLIFKGG